jgi:acyl-CoA-binding protein
MSADDMDDAGPSSRDEAVFEGAADHIGRLITAEPGRFSDRDKLQLYGLYKQATAGDCTSSRPGFFHRADRAKWCDPGHLHMLVWCQISQRSRLGGHGCAAGAAALLR